MRPKPEPDLRFPTWLTLSWAWEQAMEDSEAVKAGIARNLRALREVHGLSQRALADLAQTDLATLKAVESARLLPSIGLIAEFARVLEVPCTAFTASCAAAPASLSMPQQPAGNSPRIGQGNGKTPGNRLPLRPSLGGRAI